MCVFTADYGKWSTHVKGWERGITENPDAPIYVIHYEKLKRVGGQRNRIGNSFLNGRELISSLGG